MSHTIAVLGSGSWGTALAVHLARTGHDVRLWARDRTLAAAMANDRRNPAYLPGIVLPPALKPTSEMSQATSSQSDPCMPFIVRATASDE